MNQLTKSAIGSPEGKMVKIHSKAFHVLEDTEVDLKSGRSGSSMTTTHLTLSGYQQRQQTRLNVKDIEN
jgi:hypothetical protein